MLVNKNETLHLKQNTTDGLGFVCENLEDLF